MAERNPRERALALVLAGEFTFVQMQGGTPVNADARHVRGGSAGVFRLPATVTSMGSLSELRMRGN